MFQLSAYNFVILLRLLMKMWCSIFFLLLFVNVVFSQDEKSGIEISGDILEYAMPAMALTSTFIWKDDQHSTWQFVKSIGSAFVISRSLKYIVDKERPDGGPHSFPSGHTTSAFCSAAFFERHYGWKVGVPAYLVAGYVGWSRVYSDRHDWWDVLGGAVIGTTCSYIFTKKYKKDNLDVAFNIAPDNYGVGICWRF